MPNPSSTSPGPLPEEIRNLLAGKEREGGGDTGGGGAGRRAGRDRSAQPSPSAGRGGGPSRGIAVPVCRGAGLEGSGRVCHNELIFPSEPES